MERNDTNWKVDIGPLSIDGAAIVAATTGSGGGEPVYGADNIGQFERLGQSGYGVLDVLQVVHIDVDLVSNSGSHPPIISEKSIRLHTQEDEVSVNYGTSRNHLQNEMP